MEKSRYSRTEARIVYYTALLEERRYRESLGMVESLMNDFPDNHVFYGWAEAVFKKQQKFVEGARYMEDVAMRQSGRSPRLAQHALLGKARLEHLAKRDNEARKTLERVRAIGQPDRLIRQEIAELEKKVT